MWCSYTVPFDSTCSHGRLKARVGEENCNHGKNQWERGNVQHTHTHTDTESWSTSFELSNKCAPLEKTFEVSYSHYNNSHKIDNTMNGMEMMSAAGWFVRRHSRGTSSSSSMVRRPKETVLTPTMNTINGTPGQWRLFISHFQWITSFQKWRISDYFFFLLWNCSTVYVKAEASREHRARANKMTRRSLLWPLLVL